MSEEKMTKRWAPLIVPMGSCNPCIHKNQCEEIKRGSGSPTRFRCPLEIEVTGEYSKSLKKEGWVFKGEWIFEGPKGE